MTDLAPTGFDVPKASTTPVDGDDAGPAQPYWDQQKADAVGSAHERASRHVQAARDALDASMEAAEGEARMALAAAAEAYWLSEGTEGAVAEHLYLHQIGAWTRQTIGCELDWDGSNYTTTCPVKRADERWGSSPGFVARKWCSICDGDLSECPHLPDRLYWVAGGPTSFGPCRVCRNDECQHEASQLYPAPAVSIVKEVDELLEISIVDVPAQPTARPTSVTIRTTALHRAVRRAFPAAPAKCLHCLKPYHGLPVPKDWSLPMVEALMAPSDMTY
jgi:hypothetical protein